MNDTADVDVDIDLEILFMEDGEAADDVHWKCWNSQKGIHAICGSTKLKGISIPDWMTVSCRHCKTLEKIARKESKGICRGCGKIFYLTPP